MINRPGITASLNLSGLGMPYVHWRPSAKDLKAAANCDHDHVSVVTASDVHVIRSADDRCAGAGEGVVRRYPRGPGKSRATTRPVSLVHLPRPLRRELTHVRV
jgi:hypothetical protein